MTTTEVEWDEDTRAAALALKHYQATLCPNCGQPMSVCQSADNEGMYDAGLPYRCHATTAVIDAQERMGDDVHAPAALMFSPTLRNGASTR